MSDFDLDRLGDLWRAQPDPAEMERLRRAAEAGARRARWGHLFDLALSLLVSSAVVLLVWSEPTVKNGLAGAVAILLMLGSHVRQRQLRKLELKGLTGSSEQMLDQSIERIQATLKRIRFGLVTFAPGILVGLGFAATLSNRAGSMMARLRENHSTLALVSILFAIVLVALSLYVFNLIRTSRAELDRLTTLRDAYRRESEDAEE